MKTNKFTVGFDAKIVFLHRIDRNFRDMNVLNPPLVQELNKILFRDPIHEDLVEQNERALKQSLAIAIAGDYHLKKLCIGVGGTNTAKGLISPAMMNSFGGYVDSFNQNNLLHHKNTVDEERKHAWVYNLNNKHLIFGNEIQKDKFSRYEELQHIVPSTREQVGEKKVSVKKGVRERPVEMIEDGLCEMPNGHLGHLGHLVWKLFYRYYVYFLGNFCIEPIKQGVQGVLQILEEVKGIINDICIVFYPKDNKHKSTENSRMFGQSTASEKSKTHSKRA